MRCPRCSNDIHTDESFCGQCGLSLRSSTTDSNGRLSRFPSHIQPSSSFSPNVSDPVQSKKIDASRSRPGVFHQTSGLHVELSSPVHPPLKRSSYSDYRAGKRDTGNVDNIRIGSGVNAFVQPLPGQSPRSTTSGIMPGQSPRSTTSGIMPGVVSQAKSESAVNIQTKRPLRNNLAPTIAIVGICLLVILVGVIGVLTLSLSNPASNGSKPQGPSNSHPVGVTQTKTPIASPMPVPDAGFTYCNVKCMPQGFMDEYPISWHFTTITGTGMAGAQFINPKHPDELAIYKVQVDPTTTADVLLAVDVQAAYASKPDYQVPANIYQVTIHGQQWAAENFYYLNGLNQLDQVAAYATIHQNRVYILDFQAPKANFNQVSIKYFNAMINKFQFA